VILAAGWLAAQPKFRLEQAKRQMTRQNQPKKNTASEKTEGNNVPLTETVNFKTALQKGNRIQLPKLVR